ncbi:uncharacterized protein LOC135845081 [Planococcus citri]|uniref:uncharacterized protein LOC135845081 n=1 Tax=Planococcus citri TaxID=170843 RepID=UPI0031F9C0C9
MESKKDVNVWKLEVPIEIVNLLNKKSASEDEWSKATAEFYKYVGQVEYLTAARNQLFKSNWEIIGEKSASDYEKKQLEQKLCQSWAIVFLRSMLEDILFEMEALVSFPDKNEMISQLKKKGKYVSGAHSTYNFNNMASIHFVKWLYLLTFSDVPLAREIKKLLNDEKVPIEHFCILVGLIFTKTSAKIHCPSLPRSPSTEDIRKGLFQNGVRDERLLNAASIIPKIQDIPLSQLYAIASTTPSTSIKQGSGASSTATAANSTSPFSDTSSSIISEPFSVTNSPPPSTTTPTPHRTPQIPPPPSLPPPRERAPQLPRHQANSRSSTFWSQTQFYPIQQGLKQYPNSNRGARNLPYSFHRQPFPSRPSHLTNLRGSSYWP